MIEPVPNKPDKVWVSFGDWTSDMMALASKLNRKPDPPGKTQSRSHEVGVDQLAKLPLGSLAIDALFEIADELPYCPNNEEIVAMGKALIKAHAEFRMLREERKKKQTYLQDRARAKGTPKFGFRRGNTMALEGEEKGVHQAKIEYIFRSRTARPRPPKVQAWGFAWSSIDRHREEVDYCLDHLGCLNEWEVGFLTTIAQKPAHSPRQVMTVQKIVNKVARGGIDRPVSKDRGKKKTTKAAMKRKTKAAMNRRLDRMGKRKADRFEDLE
jgi:hypothetical protein